jgi:putative ABC transport system permease protein
MTPGVKSSGGSARVNIAWHMLTHRKRRLAIALAALGFAVVVMFMQLGFFNGFNESQARLANHFDGDLVVMDARRLHFNSFTALLRLHVGQVKGTAGVAEAVPIQNYGVRIKNPDTGQYRRVYLLAWIPGTHPFKFGAIDERALERTGAVLFDRRARDIYGKLTPGMVLDIEGGKFTLAGFFDYGPNFSNDGNLITSEATMLLRLNGARDKVDWILVRLEPGAEVEHVRARLIATLPRTLSVLTPEEMRMREVAYTTRKAPIGIVFGIGLIVGFIIGTSICHQILFNEINDHLGQFATLKAMGFSDGYLRRIVLTEAALLGACGFVPGLAGAWFLYRVIERMTGIVMTLGPGYAAFVFALTVAMCVLAGLLAVRRVLKSDSAALL